MNKNETHTTSVKLSKDLFDQFKITSIKYKFTFQKLAERCTHLYLTDPEFRKLINNHTNLELKEDN
jgi:hypothetical protein